MIIKRAISLTHFNGDFQKEYHLQLEREKRGYQIYYQRGVTGRKMFGGQKTIIPLSDLSANLIFTRVINHKLTQEGYTAMASAVLDHVGIGRIKGYKNDTLTSNKNPANRVLLNFLRVNLNQPFL